MDTNELISKAEKTLVNVNLATLGLDTDVILFSISLSLIAVAKELARAGDWHEDDDKYRDYLASFSHLRE